MSSRSRSKPEPKPQPMYRWLISRIRGTPAALLGFVEAPDRDSAIQQAIVRFEIKPEHQDRLLAVRAR